MAKEYSADSIKALEGLEAVRKRPAMYIGDVGVRGMHHLVWEIVDNCIDEAMAGHAKTIVVTINGDNSVSVMDDGRGIPVDYHKDKKMSALTVVMTVLHAGGKFDKDSYKVSGGLHGVGASVVNALSAWLEVEVCRDGKIWFQRFERGVPKTQVEERGKAKRNGTKVVFKPDAEIFTNCDNLDYNYETIINRTRELAFLNKGIRIDVIDERVEGKKESFKYDGGLRSYVEHLNKNKTTIHADVIDVEGKDDVSKTEAEIALQYNDSYVENVYSFVNNINTIEGGTHLSGFRSALTRCLNNWARKNNVIKEKDDPLQGEDCREGLTAIVSVRVPEPQFEGQTKGKLGNREVQSIVEGIVNDKLTTYFEEHPGNARSIVNRAVAASAARMAARKARDMARRKNALNSAGMPGKLADCISHDKETTEIYLVEGDSAGGSAKSGRDTRTQAILPLRGKILNVEKHRLDKVLENTEITSMITAFGTGVGTEEFDIEKLRYNKIIIMTDADVDGSHIRTLILTFFYRYMPDLIRTGHVYIAQPPLYRVQRRKKVEYVLSEEKMNKSLIKLGMEGTKFEIRDNGHSGNLSPEKFAKLLADIQTIQKLARLVERRGIMFPEYAELRAEHKGFPKYRAVHEEKTLFFLGDEEYKKYIEAQEKKGKTIAVVEEGLSVLEAFRQENNGTAEPQQENESVLALTEFSFCDELEEAAKSIEKAGLEMKDYFPPADPAAPARFFLVGEQTEEEMQSLSELVHSICSMGKRGMEITRYKGLGEMSPDQLWETTMDPEKRMLLQVSIGDESEADSLFTLLMGELVEPRREFIERYGPEVSNLDV